MTNLLLTALLLLSSWHATGTEHKVTWYWPGEDNWGTAIADQGLMARFNGCLPDESWGWPIVAVTDDLLDDYPYGTWLYISGEGLKRVSDHCPQWDTIDIRVPERHMDMREGVRVWVVWKP